MLKFPALPSSKISECYSSLQISLFEILTDSIHFDLLFTKGDQSTSLFGLNKRQAVFVTILYQLRWG